MTQQKKTETFEVGELPDLNPDDRVFVEGLLAGKSASDAYRAAFNTDHMQQNSIWTCASRLRHSAKVSLWLQAARMANLGSATVTLGSHLQELERLRELAAATGNYGAAVNAEVSRGKAAGHYVEKIQDVTRENDVASTLKDIAAISPDLARELASQHGVPWNNEQATKH